MRRGGRAGGRAGAEAFQLRLASRSWNASALHDPGGAVRGTRYAYSMTLTRAANCCAMARNVAA